MKKILITGANSYIGTSFEKWLQQWPDQYLVDTVDMKDGSWKEKDFTKYDVVFHVAGIAHVDIKKATKEMKELYYSVNRDLTIETAKKAKMDGVKQFVFMSSIIVYGESSPIGTKKIITKDTIPDPTNFYGDSKLQAECGILQLQSDEFNVVVLRPPMIYGKGSKGNYIKLSGIARKLPLFPAIDNERSMLFIYNFCEFIHIIVDNQEKGVFFPQNNEYVKTSELVRLIALAHGKKIHLTRTLYPFVRLLARKMKLLNKVFGNLVYDKELSIYKNYEYCIADLDKTVQLAEGKLDENDIFNRKS